MISVSTVELEELSVEELGLLVRYCDQCFDPISYEDIISRVRSGIARIYRFSGDCTGVFILAVGDGGLYIETVSGQNVIKNFDELYKKIKVTARGWGAKNLYSYVSRDSLKRLYDRKTRAEPVATLYREVLK